MGTSLKQTLLERLKDAELALGMKRLDGGRYLVHGNSKMLGEVPSIAAKAFAAIESHGGSVLLYQVKIVDLPASFADPRDAALSLFDDDSEDDTKLGVIAVFRVHQGKRIGTTARALTQGRRGRT